MVARSGHMTELSYANSFLSFRAIDYKITAFKGVRLRKESYGFLPLKDSNLLLQCKTLHFSCQGRIDHNSEQYSSSNHKLRVALQIKEHNKCIR